MLTYHKTNDNIMTQLETYEHGCWVNLIAPTEEEMDLLTEQLGIDSDFLRAALDEEETSRIDKEDDQTLIIIDTPWKEAGEEHTTLPLGIIVAYRCIITVSLRESVLLTEFQKGGIRTAQTQKKTSFILHILLQVAKQFLTCLRQIDRSYNQMERQLYRSLKNDELIQLIDLEKSLVYFNTALKANEATLEKILRGRAIPLYEEDHDLLDDVLIEVRQAIEMTNIYSSIISNMMNAFSSVISNNLNVTMKVLTSLTILLTLPNIIFGFYGMNVLDLPYDQFWWYPMVLALGSVVVVALLLKFRDLF